MNKHDTGGRNHKVNVALKRTTLVLLTVAVYAAIGFMLACYLMSPTINGDLFWRL